MKAYIVFVVCKLVLEGTTELDIIRSCDDNICSGGYQTLAAMQKSLQIKQLNMP